MKRALWIFGLILVLLLPAVRGWDYARKQPVTFYTASTDLKTYARAGEGVRAGGLPSKDFAFEYPPTAAYYLAVPNFTAPSDQKALLQRVAIWNGLFCGAAMALFLIAARSTLHPCMMGAAAGAFAVVMVYGGEIVYARFDAPVSLLAAAALALALRSGKPSALAGGIGLGVAAGLKLFPALLLPTLWRVSTDRETRLRAFAGVALGLLPTVVLIGLAGSAGLDFLRYHSERHLEYGSLWASIIRLIDHCEFGTAFGSGECRAANEGLYLTAASVLTLAGALLTMALAARARSRTESLWWGTVAIYAFILFNKVGSPQYAVWPLATALPLLMDRRPRAWILLGTVILSIVLARLLMNRYNVDDPKLTWWLLGRNASIALGLIVSLVGAVAKPQTAE